MKSPLRFILRFYYQQFHNISRNKVNSIWLQLLKNQKQQSYNKMCEYEKKEHSNSLHAGICSSCLALFK